MRLRVLSIFVVLLFSAVLYAQPAPIAEIQVSVVSGAAASTGCVGCVTPDPDNLCLLQTAAPIRLQVIFSNTGGAPSDGILRFDATLVSAPPGWTCGAFDCTDPNFGAGTGMPASSSFTFVFDYTPPAPGEQITAFRGEVINNSSDDACVAVQAVTLPAAPPVPALGGIGLMILTLATAAAALIALRTRFT